MPIDPCRRNAISGETRARQRLWALAVGEKHYRAASDAGARCHSPISGKQLLAVRFQLKGQHSQHAFDFYQLADDVLIVFKR